MLPINEHPLMLPMDYRIIYRFFPHVRVRGRHRWFESVRVVQRINREPCYTYIEQWVDVGFWEEFLEDMKVPVPWEDELIAE